MTTETEKPELTPFEAAAEGQRWTGSREELWKALRKAAYRGGGSYAAWRILESGLIISLEIATDMQKIVRFGHHVPPAGQESRFLTACERYLSMFDVVGEWTLVEHGPGPLLDGRDGYLATYRERFKLHPIDVRCADCGTPVQKDDAYAVQRCVSCGVKAGKVKP